MCSSAYTCSGYCYQSAKNESGRSMVEMLGVLAVIGVLSVAGVAGFKTAMEKHRANEIMYGANKRSAIGIAQLAQGRSPTEISFGEFDDNDTGYGTFDDSALAVGTSSTKFGVKVSNVGKSICQNLVNMAGGPVSVTKAATPETPMTAADCADLNAIAFIFEAMDSDAATSNSCTTDDECGTGSACFFGSCHSVDTTCDDGVYIHGVCVTSGYCSGTYDCETGYMCNFKYYNQANWEVYGICEETPGCSTDSDCDDYDGACVNGVCSYAECSTNDNCAAWNGYPEGYICDFGRLKTNTYSDYGRCRYGSCSTHADCPEHYLCKSNGMCSYAECSSDWQCPEFGTNFLCDFAQEHPYDDYYNNWGYCTEQSGCTTDLECSQYFHYNNGNYDYYGGVCKNGSCVSAWCSDHRGCREEFGSDYGCIHGAYNTCVSNYGEEGYCYQTQACSSFPDSYNP